MKYAWNLVKEIDNKRSSNTAIYIIIMMKMENAENDGEEQRRERRKMDMTKNI